MVAAGFEALNLNSIGWYGGKKWESASATTFLPGSFSTTSTKRMPSRTCSSSYTINSSLLEVAGVPNSMQHMMNSLVSTSQSATLN
jgi:hypothetical protein